VVIEASPASGHGHFIRRKAQGRWDDHDITVIPIGELGRVNHDH
jgi:hypothetical protein